MANPQCENGYTKIANMLLEGIMSYQFTGRELRVLGKIMRETYGWKRKKAQISYGAISKATGISRPNVIKVVKKLITDGILFAQATTARHGFILGINKDYEKWQPRAVDNSGAVVSMGIPAASIDGDTSFGLGGIHGDTKSGIDGDTTSKKKENDLKESRKERDSAFIKSRKEKREKYAQIVTGREAQILNGDPKNLINALYESGIEITKAWGAIVQSREKKNPAGYLVAILSDAKYQVADSAMEQAKQEMRKWGY